jgi:hypothetical protein
MPFVERGVAFDCERRHLEQILNSRTHKIASAFCAMMIRSPLAQFARRTATTLVSYPEGESGLNQAV